MPKTQNFPVKTNHVVHGSGPYWYQIGNKTCYVPKVDKLSVEKDRLGCVIFSM